MKIDWNKKYNTIAVYTFIVAASIILFPACFIISSPAMFLENSSFSIFLKCNALAKN